MEDITTYGEISGAKHKGETSSVSVGLGFCLALAGLFFVLNGLYHVGVSLTPYWERVSLGELAETKGSGNFIAFLVITLGRPAFGLFLWFLALEVWDGQGTVRRWLYLVVLPVVYSFFSGVGSLGPEVGEQLWSYGFLARNPTVAAAMASIFLVSFVLLVVPFVGWAFRTSENDPSWVTTIASLLVGSLVLFGCLGQLDPIEADTALYANLPPFSVEDSGMTFLVLESTSLDYLDCMDNILAIEEACRKRNKLQAIRYENFDGKLRTAHLLEILVEHRNLADPPMCPAGGTYVVSAAGKWHCTEHGTYDKERVERAEQKRALLEGAEAAGDETEPVDGDY